jgi:hypothetical protein
MQTTIVNDTNVAHLDVCTNPQTPLHLSSTVMKSSENYTEKTWSLSPSPLTPMDDLAQCSRLSSPLHTTHVKNLGTPTTPIKNIIDQTQTSCTNGHSNHHALLESSHPPTSYGHNPPHQHDERSLETLIPHPHQVYTPSNSLDSAYLKHTAHYYVTPPVRSNFIQLHLHLIYTHTSLWKIHTP